MNLYAIYVCGFPERFAEPFLAEVLNSLGGKVVGEPITVKASKIPAEAEYAAFYETSSSRPQALASYIKAQVHHYMMNRGNDPNEGNYVVSVAVLRMGGKVVSVGRSYEAKHA